MSVGRSGGIPTPGSGAAHVAPAEASTNGAGAVREPQGVPDPAEVVVPDELRAEVEELMGRYPQKRSAAIPALWAIQRRDGWCTPEGILQVAAVMGVTPAYLESVASFYDLLRTSPVGRDRVLVCTNISCWMRGADELLASFCDAVGVDAGAAAHGGATSADGSAFVSGFECLGACDIAPMASVNERYFGPLSNADAERIIVQLRDGEEVLPEKAISKLPAAGAALGADPAGRGQSPGTQSPEPQEVPGDESEPEDPSARESEADR